MAKRGAVDWTVGKLLSMILLILVLVLVIYGVTQGGLNPLIERMGGVVDSVLVLLHVKDDGFSEDNCWSEKVSALSDGKDFLDNLGVEGTERDKVVLDVCKNAVCILNMSELGAYRLRGEEFERLDGGDWESYDSFFEGSFQRAKLNWELYNGVLDILGEDLLEEFYGRGFTKQFVLYGNGEGFGRGVFALWKDGQWTLFEERESGLKILYEDSDDSMVIGEYGKFIDAVWTRGLFGNDDKVYYKTLDSNFNINLLNSEIFSEGDLIGNLVGDSGDFDEIDSLEDVRNLNKEFLKRKEKFLEGGRMSEERNLFFEEFIRGKSITFEGKEFELSVEFYEGYPIILFTPDESFSKYPKMGFMYGAIYSKKSSISFLVDGKIQKVNLRNSNGVLVEWNSILNKWNWVYSTRDYKLPKKYFDKVYEVESINNFLLGRCG